MLDDESRRPDAAALFAGGPHAEPDRRALRPLSSAAARPRPGFRRGLAHAGQLRPQGVGAGGGPALRAAAARQRPPRRRGQATRGRERARALRVRPRPRRRLRPRQLGHLGDPRRRLAAVAPARGLAVGAAPQSGLLALRSARGRGAVDLRPGGRARGRSLHRPPPVRPRAALHPDRARRRGRRRAPRPRRGTWPSSAPPGRRPPRLPRLREGTVRGLQQRRRLSGGRPVARPDPVGEPLHHQRPLSMQRPAGQQHGPERHPLFPLGLPLRRHPGQRRHPGLLLELRVAGLRPAGRRQPAAESERRRLPRRRAGHRLSARRAQPAPESRVRRLLHRLGRQRRPRARWASITPRATSRRSASTTTP